MSTHVGVSSAAKLLPYVGNGWYLVEFAVALAAGIAAGAIALVGFGLDRL